MPGGNIKDDPARNPFPRAGLVKQYEPFIRKEVGQFCRRYSWLPHDEVLIEAIRIALQAEKKFKPEFGFDFSTFLRPYLKGLNRFADKEQELRRVSVDDVDFGYQKAQEAEEAKEAKTPGGEFYPGPNGERFTLDFQWMDINRSPIINEYYGGSQLFRAAQARKRAVVRVRLANGEVLHYALSDVRLLVPVKTHFDGTPADLDKRQGYVRAMFDHHYRRQAEAEQEAENRKRGDYNPVFLEAKPVAGGVDIKERAGRAPPRLLPDWMPMASLNDAYSHDDGWQGTLSDTIAQGAEARSQNDRIIDAIKAERSFMSESETAVADWMIGALSGSDSRNMVQFAADRGISKGYASKLRERIAEKVKARLSGSPKQNNFEN